MFVRYRICRPSVYLYLRPSCESPVSDQLLFGTQVYPIAEESENGFVRVETSYGYCGYLKTAAIGVFERRETERMYTVCTPFADVLPRARYKERPIVTLPKGSLLAVKRTESDGRFVGVRLFRTEGYVRRDAIRPTGFVGSRKDLRKSVCDDALSYLGTPYRYGGKTPSGIDCSGLCFMAYALNGLPLWRDAVPDRRYVCEIGMESLLPGDLLYFPGHTALFIGGGEYVHADASEGFVTVNSLVRGSILYRADLAGRLVCCARSIELTNG